MTPLATPVSAETHDLDLSVLKPGMTATVTRVDVAGDVGERLMEMGLTPGTQITFVRRGLWGDPIQVRVRGFMLTLRRAQAREIRVVV